MQPREPARSSPHILTIVGSVVAVLIGCDSAGSAEQSFSPHSPTTLIAEADLRFGSNREEHGLTAVALPDGGFLVGGSFDGRGLPCDGSAGFPLLMRLDHDLGLRDTTVFRQEGNGQVRAIVPHRNDWAVLKRLQRYGDDGCIPESTAVISISGADGAELSQLWVGEGIWSRAGSIQPLGTSDIVIGLTGTYDSAEIVKVNQSGRLLWTYRPPPDNELVEVISHTGGDLVAVSHNHHGRYSLGIVDEGGRPGWTLDVETDSTGAPWDVSVTDFGAVVLGRLRDPVSRAPILFATQFGRDGAVLWEYRVNQGRPYPAVTAGLGSGYVAISYFPDDEYSQGGGSTRPVIVLLDSSGHVVDSAYFGPAAGDVMLNSLLWGSDGRLIAVGSVGPSDSVAGDDFDVLVSSYVTN